MSHKKKILTVDRIEKETDKAVAVKDTKGVLVYLPKSQIEIVKGMRAVAIHVPAWLADQHETLEFSEE